jgi:hypothetical protein
MPIATRAVCTPRPAPELCPWPPALHSPRPRVSQALITFPPMPSSSLTRGSLRTARRGQRATAALQPPLGPLCLPKLLWARDQRPKRGAAAPAQPSLMAGCSAVADRCNMLHLTSARPCATSWGWLGVRAEGWRSSARCHLADGCAGQSRGHRSSGDDSRRLQTARLSLRPHMVSYKRLIPSWAGGKIRIKRKIIQIFSDPLPRPTLAPFEPPVASKYGFSDA